MTGEEMNLTDEDLALWAGVVASYGDNFDKPETEFARKLLRTISTLRTQLSEAREGLRPFAASAGAHNHLTDDGLAYARVGHLRRARDIVGEG